MITDYCDYPPRFADDLELTEQQDGDRQSWIVGSASINRFIILRETEFKVFQLLEEALTPSAVCLEFKQRHGGNLTLATLTKFLTKLEQIGILAGKRTTGYAANQAVMRQPYIRFRLFNPDQLFARMVPALRWVWTPTFFVLTLLFMISVAFLSALNWAALSNYGAYIIREHYVAMFVAGWMVVVTHEFAHGLTCKAFGGRATEVGVLGVYYFIPALYCNVSGIHLIKKRGQRLWVIAAGVYWQLLVGTTALLIWLIVEPYTFLSDLALIFCLGSLLNIVFNANPLIKLDGYYFLSQWLRLPNLMSRSRDYWRSLWNWLAFGERNASASKYGRSEKVIYALFGFLSVAYSALLTWLIVSYVGSYLIDEFQLPGLLLTGGVVFLYARRPLKSLFRSATDWLRTFMINPSESQQLASVKSTAQPAATLLPATRNPVADQPATAMTEKQSSQARQQLTEKPAKSWRRLLVPPILFLLIFAALLLPWEASVGSFGTLTPMKEKESVISTPEAGMVTVLVKPGELVETGKELARLGNPDLSSDLIALRADIVREEGEFERLSSEIKTRQQATVRASAQLNESTRLAREFGAEQKNILTRKLSGHQSEIEYPAAIAVLQSDIDLKKSRLNEAQTQLARTRQLFQESLIPKSDLETVENKVTALKLEIEAAQEKVQNAIVEHRRQFEKYSSEVRLNQSELQTTQSVTANTSTEIEGKRRVLEILRQRGQILQSKQTSVILTAPRTGTVLGENLLELNGKYLEKGGEVCRVAETRQLRVRIQVPEREIGDVKEGAVVRLLTRAMPDQVFQGKVEKIGSVAELDENKQPTYRVEMIVDNTDGLLKPGMTAFTRIGFGRKTIGWILLHKIKQALRPELWLF